MGYAELFDCVAPARGCGPGIPQKSFRRIRRQVAGVLCVFGVAIAWNSRRASPASPVTSLEEEATWPHQTASRSLAEVLEHDEEEGQAPLPLWHERRLGTCNPGSCTTGSSTCTIRDCEGTCATHNATVEKNKLDNMFMLLDRVVKVKDSSSPQLDNPAFLFVPLFGIIYMFAALAIVCDEFFVPALECFVDEFGISMDVAGATFMAAGGSMPELATSFIATFQENEVGFAAIVGSAVFNVLFVIAVCAIASTETLSLTWWPLARDCSCYLIALVTTAIVFKYISPGRIEFWEALILLFEYICYCTFMKFNQPIYHWVEQKLARWKTSKVAPLPDENEGEGGSKSKSDLELEGALGRSSSKDINPNFKKPSTFRQGIVTLLTQSAYLYETAGIAAVTQIQGNLEETFKKLDKDGDNKLNTEEVKELLELIGCKHDSQSVRTALRRINRSGEDEITFEAFKRWYISSEARIEIEVNRVFTELDQDHNGTIERDEIAVLLRTLGHSTTEEELDHFMHELAEEPADAKESPVTDLRKAASGTSSANDAAPDLQVEPVSDGEASPPAKPSTGKREVPVSITAEQFESWYTRSLFYQNKQKKHELEEHAANEGLTLDAPNNGSKSAMVWYIFTYPLLAIMFCTLPDVRTEKWRRNYKIAILEFTLSLFWIAIFSQTLYECIVATSNTIGIPPAVSAVTVLAAGTSIPDLLSSYIVARNGEGDMAVSSSIGSNIFDVTVGLPLPWLSYCIVKSVEKGEIASVYVESNSLGFSLFVLILMLIAVIGTIMACKWRLTKGLGYVMLLLYLVFITQDLMNQLPDREGDHEDGVWKGALNSV
jgi:K+-dependent Na+/Ca+ exchanger-like protein